MKVYARIATLSKAIKNCIASKNSKWEVIHTNNLNRVLKGYLPSGSGFDGYNRLISCDENKMIITTDYHPMDEHGGYVSWLRFTITVKSVFNGIDMKINWHGYRGKYKFQLEEYIYNLWYEALECEVK